LIDTSNELDFSKGMPPGALASQSNCLGERIQAAFPNLKVVKSLNTIGAPVMVAPQALAGGEHTVFVSGNDTPAKAATAELLKSFGWKDVLDGFYDADGKIPCQIDGGLKCFGHPIGASGLRMLYEMYLQFQGRAGARQLKDPRIGMTHNLGGAPRENVSSVAGVGSGRYATWTTVSTLPNLVSSNPLRSARRAPVATSIRR